MRECIRHKGNKLLHHDCRKTYLFLIYLIMDKIATPPYWTFLLTCIIFTTVSYNIASYLSFQTFIQETGIHKLLYTHVPTRRGGIRYTGNQ